MAIEMFDVEEEQTAQAEQVHPAEFLRSIIDNPNIVSLLDAEMVKTIGMEVVRGYDLDKGSRADWEKQTNTAMDLALQVATEKSWPWPKAANIKYPLITTAAIQFSARAYPAIVQGAEVVKGEVLGPDPDGQKKERADRIGRHMSYQVLEEIQDWDEEEDKLLLMMAIVGCAFRKSYFDSMLGRPCSDLVSAIDLVYDHATPWQKLRRKTHHLNLFKNDVIERVRSEIFTDIELGMPEGSDNDEDAHYVFLECHCWYDIDGDGYKEPYIVTVKKDTSEVVRIIPRFDEEGIYLNGKMEITKIIPVEYFTKFSFMPNPDGGSYDIGLGLLLNPINEAVNTVFNQMLDAGTLANTGGGFIGGGLKMKGGTAKFAPGEFKQVDAVGRIADNIYHMQFTGPSNVLFQLLGMLIQAGKEMSSVQDIMTGERQANETATTTLALIEQGQKVFSAIFKRVHRGHKQEFKKLYRLNKLYLQPQDYFRFMDKVEEIYLEDYQGDDTDVTPVSDPSLVSDGQILARAEAMMKLVGDPMMNQIEIRKNYLKAIKIQNPEQFIIENPQASIPPEIQAQMQQMQEQNMQLQQAMQQMQQEMAQKEQAFSEQAQQFALTEKDIQAGIAEINSAKNELALREQLAVQNVDEAMARGELDTQARESKINELAAQKLEGIAKAENMILQNLVAKLEQSNAEKPESSEKEEKSEPLQPIINITVEKEGTVKKTFSMTAPSGGTYTGTVEGE